MSQAKKNDDKKICDAALKLAALHGWGALTLNQISQATKLSVPQIKKRFSDTNGILPAIVGQFDRETKAALGKTATGTTPHDRLFEIMIARFDVLQKHRAALLRIITEVKRNPSLARHIFPSQIKTMKTMLDLAKLKQTGPKELLATFGLYTIFILTLHTWERDESKDMSKTMSALDRYLRRAEKLADILLRTF